MCLRESSWRLSVPTVPAKRRSSRQSWGWWHQQLGGRVWCFDDNRVPIAGPPDLATAPGVASYASYLAYRDGVVAGAGSMGICDGVAQLCGAATAPVYPRRGIQTALLSSRLADAARQGCDIAVVTTQPGSKSQQNVQRRGFELLYTRAILVREP